MRGGGLMWLLGAGASAAAEIPTAWDMIWEFKQQLYVSQRRVSPKTVADLANPAVQRELQSSIDGLTKDSEGFNRIGSHWKNGVYQRVMLLRSIS